MRSRPTIYFVGAALLLLIALLIVFALDRYGARKAAGESWKRVPGDSSIFGTNGGRAAINAVVSAGSGLVAVGYASPAAAVWTSADGRSWRRVPDDKAVFGGKGVVGMSAVAAGGPGLVAVGGAKAGGDWDASVWTSRGGRSWMRVPAAEAALGGPGSQLMRAVVAAGPGLVAVGSDRGDAAVWVSREGRSWRRAGAGEPVFGGRGKQEMNAVAVAGRELVAGGFDNGDAAVWVSRDGLSWRRVGAGEPIFGGKGDQKIDGIAAGARGLVAVGYDIGHAAVWISKSGRSWARASIDESASSRVTVWSEMFGVVSGGPGLVAVGVVGTGLGGSDAAVWTSKDGRSWKGVPGNDQAFGFEGNQAMVGVVRGGPGLVAVGGDGDEAAVWTSSP